MASSTSGITVGADEALLACTSALAHVAVSPLVEVHAHRIIDRSI
jgi:hypothetical protein